MTKHTLRTVAFSLALAAGAGGLFAAQADAQTPPPAPAEHTAPHPGWHGHEHGREHRGPGFGSPLGMLNHLKPRLNLTASQQTLWDAAQARQREVGKAMRTQFMQDRKEMREQIEAGTVDFHALVAKKDAERAAAQPQLRASRDAWLAVYDSFDAKQKQIVADAMKKALHRSEHHRGRDDHRGDSRDHG